MQNDSQNDTQNEIWSRLVHTLEQFYRQIPALPLHPAPEPEIIRAHLREQYDFRTPTELGTLLAEVDELLRRWTVHVNHPRYFGLFTPGVTPASVIADALVAAYNPQLAAWSHAPAACELEDHVLKILAALFGYDAETAIAHFTTGGMESNHTATIAALTRHFPGYGEDGLHHVTGQPVFYLSQEAHDSFAKIAHMTGIGRAALRIIPVDAQWRLDLQALAAQYEIDRTAGHRPFMVVGTAGSTGGGIIDPLPDLARFCTARELWFHVDAAWGGAAILSPNLRPYLAGIEAADSISCDAHKWFSVSLGTGMFFCQHKEVLAEAFRLSAAYMPAQTAGIHDYYTTSMQWSRRFTGLKLFLSLAEKGLDGYREQIEHQTSMGELLRQRLQVGSWTLLNDTPLPVVCFTHPALDNMRTFLEHVYAEEKVWISTTLLGKQTLALRACITNFRTQPADVEYLIQALNEALQSHQNAYRSYAVESSTID